MAKGGSRFGAGRPGWHVKAENCRRLDVRRLARENMLCSGSWRWQWTNTETGEVVASIGITGAAHGITLDYAVNGTPITTSIGITHTACTYGGGRSWFSCPRCHSRAAVLYLRQSRFACRACHRLVYASQSEDVMARMWRKQAKLEARLGPNWSRPKGMHRSTHETIMGKVWGCEDTREDALMTFCERLGFKL